MVPQPISDEQADSLYEAIFIALGEGFHPYVEICDHSLKHTEAWAERNGVEPAQLREWLHDNGGYCDCEVLFNVVPDEEEGE